jgi:hypothetical protein
VELPPLQTSRTSLTRQKSYFDKEDTFWFPSSALRGIEPRPLKHLSLNLRRFRMFLPCCEASSESFIVLILLSLSPSADDRPLFSPLESYLVKFGFYKRWKKYGTRENGYQLR